MIIVDNRGKLPTKLNFQINFKKILFVRGEGKKKGEIDLNSRRRSTAAYGITLNSLKDFKEEEEK